MIKCWNNKWHVQTLTQKCHNLISLDFLILSLTQNFQIRPTRCGVLLSARERSSRHTATVSHKWSECFMFFSPSFWVLLSLMLRAYSHGAPRGSLNNPGWSLKRLRWSLNPVPLLPQTLLSSRVGLEGSYRGSWYYHFLPRVLPTVKTTGISYTKPPCRLWLLKVKTINSLYVHGYIWLFIETFLLELILSASWFVLNVDLWLVEDRTPECFSLCVYFILINIFLLCNIKKILDVRK